MYINCNTIINSNIKQLLVERTTKAENYKKALIKIWFNSPVTCFTAFLFSFSQVRAAEE